MEESSIKGGGGTSRCKVARSLMARSLIKYVTYAGLVNGMRGTAEEVILDTSVQGIQMEIILVDSIC